MQDLIHEIEWGDPIFPAVEIADWEEEVESALHSVPDLLRRVAPVPWLRKACLDWPRTSVTQFSEKLADIGELVIAQENACRYCYGVARSILRLHGHSERSISRLEREVHAADHDEQTRVFIRFCRNLSRSSPRPPKADREQLMEVGFSEKAVAEIAFHIANNCFMNRIATFISCTPVHRLEKFAGSILHRIFRASMVSNYFQKTDWSDRSLDSDGTSFAGIVEALEGLPAAVVMQDGLTGAFAPGKLTQELKVLMFAVVASTIDCNFCQSETRRMAQSLGIEHAEYSRALQTLSSPRLSSEETQLLSWTRETIRYQTGPIQTRIRQLAKQMDNDMVLEAIGIAALANSAVRLAVLME